MVELEGLLLRPPALRKPAEPGHRFAEHRVLDTKCTGRLITPKLRHLLQSLPHNMQPLISPSKLKHQWLKTKREMVDGGFEQLLPIFSRC